MAHADKENVAGKYGAAATLYSDAWQSEGGEIPHAVLEKEAVRRMLGDCTGYRILDIAGGSGNHARGAISVSGAAHVDVVDISAGFMAAGQALEAQAGRSGVIDFHLANAYKPLPDQLPDLPLAGYDAVMAVWAFDHVANLEELECLWKNIAMYLKPGGRLIAVRVCVPAHGTAESASQPVYGVKYHSFEPIENGLSYAYTLYTNPPFTIEASSMETSYTGSTELPEKAGIIDIRQFDFSQTDTVKARPEFWELLLKDPYWVGFTGKKK